LSKENYDRYSLSRAIQSLTDRGVTRGYELEWSAKLEANLGKCLQDRRGATGTLVPSSAFSPGVRAATVSGSPGLVGKKVQQLPGVLGWSAVLRSGPQMLGPFRDSDVSVYHDSNLPSAQWLPKIGNATPADVNFAASIMSPKRICGQIIVSKQLLI
jgi:hypothetical protein